MTIKKHGGWCAVSACHEISAIAGQELQRVKCCAVLVSVFGQERSIFSTCCSTGEFILDFLKVILPANHFLFLHRLLNLPRLGA